MFKIDLKVVGNNSTAKYVLFEGVAFDSIGMHAKDLVNSALWVC